MIRVWWYEISTRSTGTDITLELHVEIKFRPSKVRQFCTWYLFRFTCARFTLQNKKQPFANVLQNRFPVNIAKLLRIHFLKNSSSGCDDVYPCPPECLPIRIWWVGFPSCRPWACYSYESFTVSYCSLFTVSTWALLFSIVRIVLLFTFLAACIETTCIPSWSTDHHRFVIRKNIFACLFSIHSTISLSWPEQACLSGVYQNTSWWNHSS